MLISVDFWKPMHGFAMDSRARVILKHFFWGGGSRNLFINFKSYFIAWKKCDLKLFAAHNRNSWPHCQNKFLTLRKIGNFCDL